MKIPAATIIELPSEISISEFRQDFEFTHQKLIKSSQASTTPNKLVNISILES
jgi:hypothetical protein